MVPGGDRLLGGLVAAVITLTALAALVIGVALYLRARNALVARRWQRLEAQWSAVLLDVMAGDEPPSRLHALVPDSRATLFTDFLARYASRVRGAERLALAEAAAPWLPRLVRRARARDEARRAVAVHTLGLLGMKQYAAEVVRALDDPSPLVAMTAARALAHREHARWAPEILARLPRFDSWNRASLSALLAGIGPAAAPALREALANPAYPPQARAVAGEALRALNDLPAADTAARILRASSDRDLCATCLRLLRATGRPEHLDAVRRHLDSADAVLRAQAAGAFGAIAEPGEVTALLPRLADDSPWVVLEVARALASAGLVALLQSLAGSSSPGAAAAGQALAELEGA
ncbi:MAG TPA: HEAT repeat domain-containing protein [Gemmatimonadales bacterium]|nr:HEAT repeat domain-containing protein [Gemmatimonadales bacterium]